MEKFLGRGFWRTKSSVSARKAAAVRVMGRPFPDEQQHNQPADSSNPQMPNTDLAGGLVADGKGETEVAIRAFLDMTMAEPNMHSVIVPLGDGIFLGVKNV